MVWLEALLMCVALAGAGETVLLEFTADWCGPCRTMEPTIGRLKAQGYPVRKVNIDQHRQLAARFGVRGVPCFVMLVDGREVDRVVGATSYDRLVQMLGKSRTVMRSEDNRQSSTVLVSGAPVPPANQNATLSDQSALGGPRFDRSSGQANDGEPARHAHDRSSVQRALAATVRLKIDDSQGHSYGSGTIIDVHQDEALVVTCGHIFRNSRGSGRITVDVFQPEERKVAGQLIAYDLERDVGLVSIRPGMTVTPIRVAPANRRLRTSQRVFVTGCDRGGQPSVEPSRVTAINKFLGPPNVQVSGQPVDGRSGGGLFTTDGLLVGVCNAADPIDNEGLYAAVGSVHAELDEAGLSHVYGNQVVSLADDQRPGVTPLTSAPAMGIGPHMPSRMPAQHLPQRDNGSGSKGLDPLRSDRPEVPDAIDGKQRGAEVICIIRSLDDPDAKSKVFVLDKASLAFVKQLDSEVHKQNARQTTSWDIPHRPATGGHAQPWARGR